MPREMEDTRALFDGWAASYEQGLQNPQGPLEGHAVSLATAAHMLDIPPNAAVLDIGVGTGAFAALLDTQQTRISGIDLSEGMLDQCRSLHPNYELTVGTFTSVPFPDQRFDVVVSSFCFHEVEPAERLKACREVYRVLKPGGNLCLLDIMFASQTAMDRARQTLADRWDPDEEYALVGSLDNLLYTALFRSVRWMQTAPLHFACTATK